MPSDDLVLNVRQVAGYSPTANAPPSSALLIQLGGLGGPYASISPQDLVSTALATGGDMAIAGALAVQSVSGGSAQFSNAAINMFSAQKACIVDFAATWGTVGGVQIATVNDVSALDAALRASTVWSFNGRLGDVRLWIDDIICAGGAPIFSPRFQGSPRAETPPPQSNSSRLATTAFVANAIAGAELVASFNGRVGAVVLEAADVTALDLPYAPIDNPNFTGYATALTPPQGTSTGQLATTAFVMNAVSESTTGVASFNGRTGIVVLDQADVVAVGAALLTSPAFTGVPTAPTAALGTDTVQLATTAFVQAATGGSGGSFAPLNSPAFTGVPTAPTAAGGTNTTQLATTAYVLAAITAVDAGVLSFNGRTGAVTLLANDVSAAGGATLQSPAFTGVPTGPTALAGTSTAQLATTQFVTAAIAALAIPLASAATPLMNGTAAIGVDPGWSRGDHVHPSDTSRLALSGGTMTGAIVLPTTAATGNQAIRFNQVNTIVGAYAPLAGANFTGAITSPWVYFGAPTVTDFFANISGGANGVRALNFSGAGVYAFQFTNSSGTLAWIGNSQMGFEIDYSGAMTIRSSLTCPQVLGMSQSRPQGDNASSNGVPGNAWFQVASYNFAQSSDARGKTNITVAPPGALGAVEQIPVHDFSYRDANRLAPTRQIGWLAQEVQTVKPGNVLVGDDADETLSVNLGAMVATLWQAVQELTAQVAELEAKIA